MRNALYSGKRNGLAKGNFKKFDFFASYRGSTDRKTMRDREAINRFCAFKLLGRKNYTSGDMDTFLAQGLRQLTSLTDVARSDLRFGVRKSSFT